MAGCLSVDQTPKALSLDDLRRLPYCLDPLNEDYHKIWKNLALKNYHKAKVRIKELELLGKNKELNFLENLLAYLQGNGDRVKALGTFLIDTPTTTPEGRTCQALGYDLLGFPEKALRILQKDTHKGSRAWIATLKEKALSTVREQLSQAFQEGKKEEFAIHLQNLQALAPKDEDIKNFLLMEKILFQKPLQVEEIQAMPDHLRPYFLHYLTIAETPPYGYLSQLKDARDPWLQKVYRVVMRRWDLENLPSAFKDALTSPKLTRLEGALILSWWFPQWRLHQEALPVIVDLLDRLEFPYIAGIIGYDILPLKEDNQFHPEDLLTPMEFFMAIIRIAQLKDLVLCGETPAALVACLDLREEFLDKESLRADEAIQLLERLNLS